MVKNEALVSKAGSTAYMRESFRQGIQVKIDHNYFPTLELRMDHAI